MFALLFVRKLPAVFVPTPSDAPTNVSFFEICACNKEIENKELNTESVKMLFIPLILGMVDVSAQI